MVFMLPIYAAFRRESVKPHDCITSWLRRVRIPMMASRSIQRFLCMCFIVITMRWIVRELCPQLYANANLWSWIHAIYHLSGFKWLLVATMTFLFKTGFNNNAFSKLKFSESQSFWSFILRCFCYCSAFLPCFRLLVSLLHNGFSA